MPPKSEPTSKRVTKKELIDEFHQNQWEQRLASCQCVEYKNRPTSPNGVHPLGTSSLVYKFLQNGTLVAVVAQFIYPDGTIKGRHPVRLLIGKVYHYF